MSTFNLFTLKQNDKGQLHLFKSKKDLNSSCSTESQSICKKMEYEKGYKFLCNTDKDARTKCAEIGRPVCGTCVSNLYGDH